MHPFEVVGTSRDRHLHIKIFLAARFCHSTRTSPHLAFGVNFVLTRRALFPILLLELLRERRQCVSEVGRGRDAENWGNARLRRVDVKKREKETDRQPHHWRVAKSTNRRLREKLWLEGAKPHRLHRGVRDQVDSLPPLLRHGLRPRPLTLLLAGLLPATHTPCLFALGVNRVAAYHAALSLLKLQLDDVGVSAKSEVERAVFPPFRPETPQNKHKQKKLITVKPITGASQRLQIVGFEKNLSWKSQYATCARPPPSGVAAAILV
jgi:hypothetical protein